MSADVILQLLQFDLSLLRNMGLSLSGGHDFSYIINFIFLYYSAIKIIIIIFYLNVEKVINTEMGNHIPVIRSPNSPTRLKEEKLNEINHVVNEIDISHNGNGDKIEPPLQKHLKLETESTVSSKNFFHVNVSHDRKIKLDVDYTNHFLNAIVTAYNYHLGLHLYPDNILLCVNHILAEYINANPELFRYMFVDHKGKQEIAILIDESDSPKVFSDMIMNFVSEIRQRIKSPDLVNNMLPDYSTTREIDIVASTASVMDTVKKYFTFRACILCGLPKIFLHGGKDDWRKLYHHVSGIAEFMSKKEQGYPFKKYIIDNILPIIMKFIDTIDGNVDYKWWSHILSMKRSYGSGMPPREWSGWITKLFPTCRGYVKHPSFRYNEEPYNEGTQYPEDSIYYVNIWNDIGLDDVISGQTKVDITMETRRGDKSLVLKSGFMGVHQYTDGSLEPIVGYVFENKN
jgi:hypothetical protein